MRRPVAIAAIPLLTAAAVLPTQPAGAAAHRYTATVKSIVRPVNGAGYARTGFTVTSEPSNQANCSFPDPAPSAVSPNIESCFPTAAGAFACWKAAAANKVLCIRNPRARKLVRIPRVGPFAATAKAPRAQRAPLSMVLANGDYCRFRTGGAGPIRTDHPQWTASYYCDSGKDVWMRSGAKHYGVFERFPSWTVIVAGETGPIVARHVLRAWFVGTYTGG